MASEPKSPDAATPEPELGGSPRGEKTPVTGQQLTQLGLVWAALGLSLLGAGAAAVMAAAQAPLPGRSTPMLSVTFLSAFADTIARLSAVITLAACAGAVAFSSGSTSPSAADDAAVARLARWAGRSARVWLVSSVVMTFANPALVNSVPLGVVVPPSAWWLSLRVLPSSLAWLVSALAALLAMVLCYRRAIASNLGLVWLLGAVSMVFVAVTGNTTVGLDHDWATDAMGLATGATLIVASAVGGALAAQLAGLPHDDAAVRRYRLIALSLIPLALAGFVVVCWQQLAGASIFQAVAGLPMLTGGVLLIAFAASLIITKPSASYRHVLLGAQAGLLLGLVACVSAFTQLVPPRFAAPQSIQINFLGYEVNEPATIARLAGLGRPNLLWTVMVASGVAAYVWAMLRVRRAGGQWPGWRLLLWLAGCGLTAYLALSGLWEYSTAVYSWHMLVHMTMNMMVPILLILGSPIVLLHTAADDPGANDPAPRPLRSASQILTELSSNRIVRVILSPPLVWLNYVGSLFAVYFSPLFGWLMKYHWAHQLMLLHFLIAGLAFFSMVAGPQDRIWHLPYLLRFALLMSVMPFHAIFAVGIMSSREVIGGNFYRTLAIPWVGDLMADQDIAGQITWFTGEVPALVAVIALGAQWFRSDSKEAAVADSPLGHNVEDLDAYNDLLAELAHRDADPTSSQMRGR